MGFPLAFPMPTQLWPQPSIVFIEKDERLFSFGRKEKEQYNTTLDLLIAKDIRGAQKLWDWPFLWISTLGAFRSR